MKPSSTFENAEKTFSKDETGKEILFTLNILLSVIGGSALALLSMIYLGSYEDLVELKKHLVQSFFKRLASLSIIGMCGVFLLFLLNVFVNFTLLKNKPKLKIWQMALIDAAIVIGCVTIGTLLFFA